MTNLKFFDLFLQGYEEELALLNASYYSDVDKHEMFVKENLHFMSDMMLGYNIVKSTVLQTKGNYKAPVNGPKQTILFRLKRYSVYKSFFVICVVFK